MILVPISDPAVECHFNNNNPTQANGGPGNAGKMLPAIPMIRQTAPAITSIKSNIELPAKEAIFERKMAIRVLFVCLGNICRSPMAEGIFTHLLQDQGLDGLVEVDSAGTSGYHSGELADERMRKTAAKKGIKLTHRARKVRRDDLDTFDYVIAMDRINLHDLENLHPEPKAKLMLFRGLNPQSEPDVPDPYYGNLDGFQEVLNILEFHGLEWIDYLKKNHAL